MSHPTATVASPSTCDDATLELEAARDWFDAHAAEREELEAEAAYLAWQAEVSRAREAIDAMPPVPMTPAEIEAWFDAPGDVRLSA